MVAAVVVRASGGDGAGEGGVGGGGGGGREGGGDSGGDGMQLPERTRVGGSVRVRVQGRLFEAARAHYSSSRKMAARLRPRRAPSGRRRGRALGCTRHPHGESRVGGLRACAHTTRREAAGLLRSRAPRVEDDGAQLGPSAEAVAASMLACRPLSRQGLRVMMCGILMLERRTRAMHAAQQVARTSELSGLVSSKTPSQKWHQPTAKNGVI